MKKKLLCIALLLIAAFSHSQKELWGYRVVFNYLTPQEPGVNDGKIIKIPLNGLGESVVEPEIMHEFDVTGLQGKFPRGRLFQASNGKLYGVTSYDGYNPGQGVPSDVLFEFDPILNRYKVLVNNLYKVNYAVIEPLPGLLYGTTNAGNSIFKYNINTEELTIVASIPMFLYNSSGWLPGFFGELMKASDGFLYGVTSMAPSPGNIPFPGGIYRLNLQNNQLTKRYVFGANEANDLRGPKYQTKFVEGAPGKLYGTAEGGAHVGPDGVASSGSGVIFEYDMVANTILKKFDFDFTTIGAHPSPIIKSGNKIYGGLFGNIRPIDPNAPGSVFMYDLTTEITTFRQLSTDNQDGISHPTGIQVMGSNGSIYGTSATGLYQFDPVANTVKKSANVNYQNDLSDFIEICRKPSYQSFETSSFVVCPNNPFSFDVQNTNATSYVWRKGSVILPLQTTGILNIANVTPSDIGIYTCAMTNECGTTTTMPLQITVYNCLGLDEAIGLKNAISLYPNPAKNILNVKLPEIQNFEIQSIIITNMLGQIVYSDNYKNAALDISTLQIGIYQLTLKTDKGNWIGKFIKH